jgi:segregation and condensation protein B
MNPSDNLKQIVEAALLAAGKALSLEALQGLFDELERPEKKVLRQVLEELASDYAGRGIEVARVASGWRIQVRKACAPWVSRLWEEKPGRYSRALMETLALIAYRQPITRGEIEEIRGVSVSSHIIRTLLEREWVRVVGHRDVPGKPALYATTREFLDYFGLKSLDDLPTLAEIRDLDTINEELNLPDPDGRSQADEELAVAEVARHQEEVAATLESAKEPQPEAHEEA